MSREAHVPFCEGLLGKFQRSTLLIFKEDEQRIYAGDSALNMACCRRFVQNLFRKSEGSVSVPRKMNKATWDKDYRAKVLFTSA